MNATVKEFLINHGFEEDTNIQKLISLFKSNKKFKEVNISVNATEPFMLLARCIEKKVIVEVNSIQEKRLVLKKSDRCKTVIMNVLWDEIKNCLVKDYGNGLLEFEFEVRSLRYSLEIVT